MSGLHQCRPQYLIAITRFAGKPLALSRLPGASPAQAADGSTGKAAHVSTISETITSAVCRYPRNSVQQLYRRLKGWQKTSICSLKRLIVSLMLSI